MPARRVEQLRRHVNPDAVVLLPEVVRQLRVRHEVERMQLHQRLRQLRQPSIAPRVRPTSESAKGNLWRSQPLSSCLSLAKAVLFEGSVKIRTIRHEAARIHQTLQ